MNRLLRRLRSVPTEAPKPSHAADRDSAPALVLVRPARVAPVLPAPRVRRVSARPDDPAPIFDAVMSDMEWDSLPSTAVVWDFRMEGTTVIHKAETMEMTNPPLETQFEVALYLDVDRADMEHAELAEELQEAARAVDHGWDGGDAA